MITDTHCHLYLPDFENDINDVIARAQQEGVSRFYLPCIDSDVIGDMLLLEARFPGVCFAMMGLHPCSVNGGYKDALGIVEQWLMKRKFAAVGEIGLDYHWDTTYKQEQQNAFHQQIAWALQYQIPVVIHSREATQACIDIVKEHQQGDLRGIFHCFGGSYELAKQIIDAGFYLGIGGVLTYKKAGLPAVLERINLEHMVLETDAPYLSPVPFRGKRNESSYLKYVLEQLAAVKGVSTAEAAAITTANAEKIFGS